MMLIAVAFYTMQRLWKGRTSSTLNMNGFGSLQFALCFSCEKLKGWWNDFLRCSSKVFVEENKAQEITASWAFQVPVTLGILRVSFV